MKLSFLCTDCRSWLEKHISVLPLRCHSAYKSADFHYRAGNLKSSLQGIGAAFEMAQMMLESGQVDKNLAAKWLVSTSELLVIVLSDMNRAEDGIYIHQKTSMLLSKYSDEESIQELTSKLERIERHVHDSNSHSRVLH